MNKQGYLDVTKNLVTVLNQLDIALFLFLVITKWVSL